MIRIEHIETPGGMVALAMIDRREKRNALTPDMLANLRDCAVRLREESHSTGPDGVRAVAIGGEGDVFCSGFDLSMCRDDDLAMGALLTRLSETVRAFRRLPIPVVIGVQGGAIAGGCALLGGADFVVVNADAKLGYPVVRLGVSPAVASPLLVRAVGAGRARERLLDPGLIDGREAARIGLAHECVPDSDGVRPRMMEIATALAVKPPHAIRATKLWLNHVDGTGRDDEFDEALQASLSLCGSEEERERLAALWKG